MNDNKIDELCHELFAIVSGSIASDKSIEETIEIMIKTFSEYTCETCKHFKGGVDKDES